MPRPSWEMPAVPEREYTLDEIRSALSPEEQVSFDNHRKTADATFADGGRENSSSDDEQNDYYKSLVKKGIDALKKGQ